MLLGAAGGGASAVGRVKTSAGLGTLGRRWPSVELTGRAGRPVYPTCH